MKRTKFQSTPLLVEDSLIFCSPFNEVIALDPGSGAQKWRYDPQISTEQRPANRYNCRGVAWWVDDQAAANAACRARIFMGTNDARIIALDARTGIPCADFGTGGEIKLETGQLDWPGEFQLTSAPVVSRGVVIVGSAISDNRRADAPPGTVRAFDARTGRPRWSFDPLIRSGGIIAGHANVWAPMSADEDRGLVFMPTSSPSPDFWGGKRPGNNEHANSVVALRAETGELVWSFQTVHHDVWDYDVPAQPTLARIDTGQGMRDVVIQATKQGFVFVLDRDTGKPVWPVEERAVPQGGAEGELLSPTQPFPTHVPVLVPHTDFAGRYVRPRSVQGSRVVPRAARGRAQRGPLHAALDPGDGGFSDDRRRRELGRRGVRSGQPDPSCQHQPGRAYRQADCAQPMPKASRRRRAMISDRSAARRLR